MESYYLTWFLKCSCYSVFLRYVFGCKELDGNLGFLIFGIFNHCVFDHFGPYI